MLFAFMIYRKEALMKLSILDFVTIHPNETQHEAIHHSLETLKHAEKLGYHRYWFTEHHSSNRLVSTAPDLMIALALQHVSTIRLGSGGIMLPNHAPLKVAENFSVLESLYPGKIDLGLGRAAGTNPQTALALSRSREVVIHNNFDDQVAELLHYFNKDFVQGDPRGSILLSGETSFMPNVTMLGSSRGGVEFAIKHDLPFVFAGHISPDLMEEVLNYYFDKTQRKGVAALGVICAETDEAAQRLAKPYELMWVKLSQGLGGFERQSIEAAENYQYNPRELEILKSVRSKFIAGSPETLAKAFESIKTSCNVEEIMMVDIYPDHQSRLEGYALLKHVIQ